MSSDSSYSERELFQQIAAGSEPAFRIIFDRYKLKLYYFIQHIVKSSSETEELLQDVFLRLWVSRESLANVEAPATYLFVSARNGALNHIQKKVSERKMINQLTNAAQEEYNIIEEELSFKESRQLVEEAISKLSPQQQKVYRLSKEAGLSRDEIAAQLGISPNTVKNHLADAMLSIRTYMKDHSEIILLILLSNAYANVIAEILSK
ncbi:MAG: RNA polymerase sigma-70 factor [Chitinophagaceae bacterium]